jgi:hypothetical protein
MGILSVAFLGQGNIGPGDRPGVLATPSLPIPLPASRADAEKLTAVIQRNCVVCHNDQLRTGNLSLQSFRVGSASAVPETAEKMIVKLRADMMPPPRMPRPGGDTLRLLAQTLEDELDEYWDDRPNPGARPFQRLNRREYERAIHDVFGLQVDAGDWLPLDQFQANFDNMAFVQGMSATLLTGYLNAAGNISRLAVGQPGAPAASRSYGLPESVSQHQWEHVEGAPYGTRGGLVVTHSFPADGSYEFDLSFYGGGGQATFEDIDISIDGEKVAVVPYSADFLEQYAANQKMEAGRFFVAAGEHRVAVSFTRTADGPYEDLIRPLDGGHAGRSAYGTTGLPHLRDLTIIGPFEPAGVSENPVRARLFACRPASSADARSCAQRILRPIATRAFRRPVSEADLVALLRFYDQGEAEGGFESGVRTAIEAILSSPDFIFRLEREPAGVAPGKSYPVDDFDLASRLSFFLWGTIPDEELLRVAGEGKLSKRGELQKQARRMLADPRSEALGERFAAQWLRLQDMSKVQPDLFWYPDFTRQIEVDLRRETILFFNNLVREDKSVLELYDANYTFVNERLASHYGIPGVIGEEFRRVRYPEGSGRSGILGHGSVQLLTSMGNRTSPVLRGKWVMEVLLGTPPPPPPPSVPALAETSNEGKDGRLLTGRERLAIHRASPVCSACHQYMDPIGVALENFDVDGTWRLRERDIGLTVDSRGTLYDGQNIESQAALVGALLKRPTPLLRTFTTNLMAYAMGRRVEYFDQPAVREIVATAAENDYRLSEFIVGVVMSDQFRMRTARPTTAPQ